MVRAACLVHTVLLVVILVTKDTNPTLAFIFLCILLVDLAFSIVFTFGFPSPVTGIVTPVMWRCRGASVSAVPYKVAVGVYAGIMMNTLFCGQRASQCLDDVEWIYEIILLNFAVLALFRTCVLSAPVMAVIKVVEYGRHCYRMSKQSW